jgi:hypothetical protein
MGWLKGAIAGWLPLSEGSFAETVALKVFEVGLVNSARMTPPDTSGFSPSGKTLEATSNTGQVSGSGTAARMGVFGLVFPARWESTSSNGEACDNWLAAVWGAGCADGALLVPVLFDESLSEAEGDCLEETGNNPQPACKWQAAHPKHRAFHKRLLPAKTISPRL